jgi:M-phase inducer phosphatase 2
MEVPLQKSAPGSALSPARVLGGIQRPRHLSVFEFESDGFLGSPEPTASSSPVTTLTQTMHNLAGLGR